MRWRQRPAVLAVLLVGFISTPQAYQVSPESHGLLRGRRGSTLARSLPGEHVGSNIERYSTETVIHGGGAGIASVMKALMTAPPVGVQAPSRKVSVADLVEFPYRYIGKRITVTADVEEVFGPRLFKIDESSWASVDGEVLVYTLRDTAALVRATDVVIVTGTMEMFLRSDLEPELSWLGPAPEVGFPFSRRPVFVASEIVTATTNRILTVPVSASTPTDTGLPPITDPVVLGRGDGAIVGRQVSLRRVTVMRAASTRGFWVDTTDGALFVLPAAHPNQESAVSAGQSMMIRGLVLDMPRAMRQRARKEQHRNDAIYVYATTVQ